MLRHDASYSALMDPHYTQYAKISLLWVNTIVSLALKKIKQLTCFKINISSLRQTVHTDSDVGLQSRKHYKIYKNKLIRIVL